MRAFLFAPVLLAAGSAAHLHLSLSRPHHEDAAALQRRQGPTQTDMKSPRDLQFHPYAVDVGVGTPPQNQRLALTLSTIHSFVLDRRLCFPESGQVSSDPLRFSSSECKSGAFEGNESSTYSESHNGYFEGTYSTRRAAGPTIDETISIGGISIDNVGLGLADVTALDTGFLALGLPPMFDPEQGLAGGVLEALWVNGVINTAAFSLWAEDGGDSVGGLLFGAVDRSKYSGGLKRVQASKFYQELDEAPEYAVNVSSAVAIVEGNDTPQPLHNDNGPGFEEFFATINPATMVTNLPLNVASRIWSLANATLETSSGWHVVDCNATDHVHMAGQISLELGGQGGFQLNSSLRDLVVPSSVWSLQYAQVPEDLERSITWCMFGIQSDNGTYKFNHDSTHDWVIGNLFLKDTYMVFDAANAEMSMAPLSNDSSAEPDILAFDYDGAHAPDSEFVGYESCFSSDCQRQDDPTYYGGNDYSAARRERTRKIIIGSVVGGVSLILILIAAWFFIRRRRLRKARAEEELMARDSSKTLFFGPSPGSGNNERVFAAPIRRKPVPTHKVRERSASPPSPPSPIEDDAEPAETWRRMSPEPKSLPGIALPNAALSMSASRRAEARLDGENAK